MSNTNRIPFADLYWQRELLLLVGGSLTVTDMLLNYAGWSSFVRASPTIRGAYGKRAILRCLCQKASPICVMPFGIFNVQSNICLKDENIV